MIIFRYDYRLNGRRETLTIGRYGEHGISLARAREKVLGGAPRSGRRLIAGARETAREAPSQGS